MNFVALSGLGNEALAAHKNIRSRYGYNLPKPSRINVAIDRQGKFTVATVKIGSRITTGVAALNPHDPDRAWKGQMVALVRALKNAGRTETKETNV